MRLLNVLGQRRCLSTLDRVIISSCHAVFKRKPLELGALRAFEESDAGVQPSWDSRAIASHKVAALLQAEMAKPGTIRLKDIVYEAIGSSVDKQTAFQSMCHDASKQTWVNSPVGIAGTQLMLSWVAEWQGDVDAAVVHAEAAFRALLLAMRSQHTLHALNRDDISENALLKALTKWIPLHQPKSYSRSAHQEHIVTKELAQHYSHALVLQAFHGTRVGDVYHRELDPNSFETRSSEPSKAASSAPPAPTQALLHNRLYPELASLALGQGQSLLDKYSPNQLACLHGQLGESLLVNQEMSLSTSCKSHHLAGLLSTALATAGLGVTPSFIHAASVALRAAEALRKDAVLSTPLEIISIQLYATLAQVSIALAAGPCPRKDQQALVDLALATSRMLAADMPSRNHLCFLDKGRWPVSPSMLDDTLHQLSACQYQLPSRGVAFAEPVPLALLSEQSMQSHSKPQRAMVSSKVLSSVKQRQRLTAQLAELAEKDTCAEALGSYVLVATSGSMEVRRVQQSTLSHLLTLYDGGLHEMSSSARVMACDLVTTFEPTLSPVTNRGDRSKAGQLAAALSLCISTSAYGAHCHLPVTIASQFQTVRPITVLWAAHCAMEVTTRPDPSRSIEAADPFSLALVALSATQSTWAARPKINPRQSIIKQEIVQPDMTSAERAYQAQLSELTHWFWSNHGSWLANFTQGPERTAVTRFALFLQHVRGVVLEFQASGASLTVLNWLLRRKT
eukprot:m.148344 g.148344  ORF g.148344 m.148344 type:complete len:737 (-) comp16282_c0_seq3:66-2276(-)